MDKKDKKLSFSQTFLQSGTKSTIWDKRVHFFERTGKTRYEPYEKC